jgi:hypothetical protein
LAQAKIALLQLIPISRPTLKGEENHGISIFSLAIWARRVLRSRPRISEALFFAAYFPVGLHEHLKNLVSFNHFHGF